MKKSTLEELGATLPVPVEALSGRGFEFKPWTMKEEKCIGDLKKKAQKKGGAGKFVRQLFDHMLVDLGGKKWEDVPQNERMLLLNQQPYSNILYMYVWLRTEALGEELKITPTTCGSCGSKIEGFKGDLNTLEVDVKDEEDKPIGLYELRKPFDFNEVRVTGVFFKNTPWDIFEKLGVGGTANEGSIKENFIQRSYVGAKTEEGGDEPVNLDAVRLLENFTKRDIEGSWQFLEEFNAGPLLKLDIDCPSCGELTERPIDWTYEHFFSSSSL